MAERPARHGLAGGVHDEPGEVDPARRLGRAQIDAFAQLGFTTVGLSIALQNVALVVWTGDFRTLRPWHSSVVIRVFGTAFNLSQVVAFVIAVALTLALFAFMKWTHTGRVMRATAQDHDAATLMGIDTDRVYRLTFAIGIACVGAAGVLVSPLYAVYPTAGLQFVLLAYAALLPLVVRDAFVLDSLILILMWGALSAAWNVAGGYAGQVSLGHAAFFGIGAYSAALMTARFHQSPWLGLLLGVVLSIAAGGVIGYLSNRLRGPYFALSTIAFSQVLLIVASRWRGFTAGLGGGPVPLPPRPSALGPRPRAGGFAAPLVAPGFFRGPGLLPTP